MKSLTEIGREEFTEKVPHGFLDIYEKLWSKYLPYRNISLLEIGVYNGNSLKVWERWFGSKSQIVGIDKYDNPIRPKLEHSIIEKGDQVDPQFLREIGEKYGPFDIIIDDGGHHWDEQQISFNYLWYYVKYRGMYLIEDLHTSADNFYKVKGYESTANYFTRMAMELIIAENPKFFDIQSFEFFNKLAVINKNESDGGV